ncbi:hypothetical protein KP509_11G057900 [Ceratopteris richardii]|nr:hypothetical protein KP509_11G057900 [Ceratopteris richardii]
MPEKFSSQLHMGSMLLENSGVDCNSSSQSLSDVHSHMIYTSIREAAPQNCGFESRVESSHAVAGAQQRFCAPSNCPPLWTNNPVQTDMSASLIPGQMLTRNHARSLTPVCSAPPQSGYNSGKNPVHNPQQIPEYCLRNGIVPGGCRDEYAFSRTNGAMGSAQNQVSAHLVLQRAGNQTQRSNPANFPALSKSSQQLGIPTMATENAFPDKGLSSSDSNHEIAVSQPAMLKPSDVAEGSSYMNGADLKYQNINRDPYAYSNLGQNYSFASSNLHPEVVNRKMPYPIAGAHLDHLQSQVQAPDMKSFGHTKTGVVETAAQLRGFGRPASENFYPPSHFQSHPLSHQRIRGTMGRSQDQVPPETWASGSSGPYMPVRGTKVTPIKSLNYHENAGFAGEGAVYNSATAGSGIGRGSNFTDSTQAYQHSALLTEAGYVNRHQPNSNLFSANTSQMAKPKSVPSHMYSTSITFESQGLTRPTPISGDIKDAQEDSLAIANLTNTNGDQYLNARHDYLYRAGAEYNNFGDGQFSALGSTIVQQVHQQALKANLQGPFPAQTKKRKKSMEELVPWHILTSKCRSQLPSISKADMDWATATNRLPHKDGGVVSNLGWLRAEIRLRLTTQLMQQIFVPLPSSIMQGKQPHNLECGVYNLSKSALEDACRLIVGAQQETEAAQKSTDVKIIASNGHMKPWNTKKEVAITELVARFMDRMKHLDFELTRFDHSMSVLELRCQSYDFERLSVIQRLGKHHGPEFSISSMENRFAEAFANHGHSIKKCPPQRYVIALPMPRKLPESARCLSL